jgi:fermentation-respiration switch protein FrsA (DUF1100 family)
MAALAKDERGLRALVTVAAWLHDETSLRDTYGKDGYELRLSEGRSAETKYRVSREVVTIPAFSNDAALAAMTGPAIGAYYDNPNRGAVPAWRNEFATMSLVPWMAFDAVNQFASRIFQPVLMIHGDNCALPENVRKFHRQLPGMKQLEWIEGNHVDFYDKPELVTFAADKVAAFFNEHP